MAVVLLAVVAAVVAIAGYTWWNDTETPAPSIDSFTECERAGYPVMESYPRQCRAGGVTYVEEIPVPVEDEGVCTDVCGDGTCAEIVCLGTGCPCAETASSCPADCQ